MRDKYLAKMAGTVLLLSLIVITAGVGLGAFALGMDHKAAAEAQTDVLKQDKSAQSGGNEASGKARLLSRFVAADSKEAADRDKNLEIACAKLNGYEIKPGAVFSFLNTTGPYTEDQGYVNGPVIVSDTEMGEDIGGGVCQVATALYNAGLQGNMEVVERKRHSFPMNYVPVGLDAVINSPDTDLKLKNTSKEPIFVFASAKGGTVTVQLFGQPLPKGEKIKIQSNVIKEITPEGEEIRFTDKLGDGERKVIQEQRTGYETMVYREHYKDGKLVNKEFISGDTYPAIQRIVLEGNSNMTK